MKGEFKETGWAKELKKNLKIPGNIYVLKIIETIANLENTSCFEKVSENEVELGR